jgi:hypothetical protein
MIGQNSLGIRAKPRNRSNSSWETIEAKEKTIIMGLSGNG